MKIPDKFDTINYTPSREEIIEYYFSLNPNGNIETVTDIILERIFDENDFTSENPEKRVTFGYIIRKYIKYIEWWNAKFSNKEEKYISNRDKKVNPITFISTAIYKEIKTIERGSRDDYIFSKLSMDILHKKLEIFNKLIYGEDYKEKKDDLTIIKQKTKSNNLTSTENPF